MHASIKLFYNDIHVSYAECQAISHNHNYTNGKLLNLLATRV